MISLFFVAVAHAQPLNNLRQKTIITTNASIQLDSLSIVPLSLSIKNISAADYTINYTTAVLTWIKKPMVNTVDVEYRVLPFLIGAATRRMSFDSVMNRFMVTPDKLKQGAVVQKPFDFGKIRSNGSLGRSLAFGNRQDAVLNSSLNLQLNGYIGDSILLSAAISDNNIPIQPDGNTQNLNEFDQVYLQFSKDKWKLSVGDLDIRQNQMYFLNFYKRLQGIAFEAEHALSKTISNKLMVSGAVAKGKFTRNVFQGTEGNQGPYRFKGANQELFFIVLAGTERVFIDGIMLQRGEDQDYVINYNTAEITFMPRQMITKDKRIQIEFEYADRNYLNTQFYVNDAVQLNKRLRFTVGYFGNGDARNAPINQNLNTNQKQFLADIGDDINSAFFHRLSWILFPLPKFFTGKQTQCTLVASATPFISMQILINKISIRFLLLIGGKGVEIIVQIKQLQQTERYSNGWHLIRKLAKRMVGMSRLSYWCRQKSRI